MDSSFAPLKAGSAEWIERQIEGSKAPEALAFVEDLIQGLRGRITADAESIAAVDAASEGLLRISRTDIAQSLAVALVECCVFYHRTGMSAKAVPAAERARTLASIAGDKSLMRRCCNMLGAFYQESLNFEAALVRLDEALFLARELNDRMLESAALANIAVTLQDMGLYRDAIRINEQVLAHPFDTPAGAVLRLQCTTNNLICALRLRDQAVARRYVAAADRFPEPERVDIILAALLRYYSAVSLIRENQADGARQLIEEARKRLSASANPRAETLLAMAAGMCEVATGRIDIGMTRLRALYEKTRSTHLYHDDVLRALIEACERAGDTSRALAYTEELIEYTTHAKKAKYTEQMKKASALVQPLSTVNEELQEAESDAARLRLASVRRVSAEYRTAENWAVVAELVDDESGQHCFRVGRLAGLLAREIGCDEQLATQIEYAARLHDLGKIGISHALLLKPGRLSPSELAIVRTHTAIGAELLEGSTDPVLKLAAQIARHHHEWWNGNGYPDGLTGETVPLAARMVSLAEVYDALTHDRPYRRAWSHHEAVAEIVSQQGSQFDPQLAAAFLRVLERYRKAGVSYTGDFMALARESSLLVARGRVAAAIG